MPQKLSLSFWVKGRDRHRELNSTGMSGGEGGGQFVFVSHLKVPLNLQNMCGELGLYALPAQLYSI